MNKLELNKIPCLKHSLYIFEAMFGKPYSEVTTEEWRKKALELGNQRWLPPQYKET